MSLLRKLCDKLQIRIQRIGMTEKVNVLRLNIALETMQPNVTAAVPAKSADNDDRSAGAMPEQK